MRRPADSNVNPSPVALTMRRSSSSTSCGAISGGSGRRDLASGPRLGDVLVAEPGFEAALSAVLGPLADALVAADEYAAREAARSPEGQVTVVYPAPSSLATDSLLDHVRCEPEYVAIARSLLSSVVIGRDVTLEGVFQAPGMIRAGVDGRGAVAVRRSQLRERIEGIAPGPWPAEQAFGAARQDSGGRSPR